MPVTVTAALHMDVVEKHQPTLKVIVCRVCKGGAAKRLPFRKSRRSSYASCLPSLSTNRT